MITYFLVGSYVVCAGLTVWAVTRNPNLCRLVQILAIGCLAALLMTGPAPMADAYYWLVLAGLGVSLVADLVFYLERDRYLLFGIGAMAFCYLLYAAAFSTRMELSFSVPVLLFYLVIPAVVLLMVGNRLGTLRGPVLFLSFVMAIMAGQATTQYLALGTQSAQLAMGGVLLFFFVDGTIAIDRFGSGESLPARFVLIELAYYSAQLLVVLSALA